MYAPLCSPTSAVACSRTGTLRVRLFGLRLGPSAPRKETAEGDRVVRLVRLRRGAGRAQLPQAAGAQRHNGVFASCLCAEKCYLLHDDRQAQNGPEGLHALTCNLAGSAKLWCQH